MFIGQGAAKPKGDAKVRGMTQPEQKRVLQDFRAGLFNVLVATSIGEEGLDIPAVDLIINFDSSSSPTRNVQRQGRTGRHKQGRVVYMLMAGREEAQYQANLEVWAVVGSVTPCMTMPRCCGCVLWLSTGISFFFSCNSMCAAQTTKRLHDMLRRPERFFQLCSTTPRMLPRAYNPERLDVELQPDSPEPVRFFPRICCVVDMRVRAYVQRQYQYHA